MTGLLLCSISSRAQQKPEPLSKAEKQEVVDSISAILDREYVFPEVGRQIHDHLRSKAAKGAYSTITDPMEFADQLTADVRSVNNDLHLRVGFNPEQIAERRNAVSPEDSLAFMERQRMYSRQNNYGFQEVKLLEGNIGYLNLSGFYEVTDEAGETAAAAMNFLGNANALIIDLRHNGGGSPSMIQLITSYLYGNEPVHLNTFYYRPQDDYSQTWTLPYVPGKRRPDMDVYVLTSQNTFSAAEEFSYNLRNLERATLVGEVTGGGAHPGGTRIATDRYTVWVPSGRAINPISKTNWEGVGVQPHVEVPADQALEVAQMQALEKMIQQKDNPNKFQLEWALAGLKAAKNPAQPDAELLATYVGQYGPRNISLEDGQLYYQREGRSKYALIPMADDLFSIEELSYFRLKVDQKDGKVVGLIGLYSDGRSDYNKRGEQEVIRP